MPTFTIIFIIYFRNMRIANGYLMYSIVYTYKHILCTSMNWNATATKNTADYDYAHNCLGMSIYHLLYAHAF